MGNYQCWLTPTTRCSANRNLNVSKQQMCKTALTLAVALFSRTAKFPPRWEALSSEGLRVRDTERLRVTCMAWCMHAYVHLLRRRHRGNLTSPAVIDRSSSAGTTFLWRCQVPCLLVPLTLTRPVGERPRRTTGSPSPWRPMRVAPALH